MTITTLSSRRFNQNIGLAKKAALDGPVFIADRGKPTHVLVSFEGYQKLVCAAQNIVDMLAMPGMDDVQFNPSGSTFQSRQDDLS